jgi:hypothetical protein
MISDLESAKNGAETWKKLKRHVLQETKKLFSFIEFYSSKETEPNVICNKFNEFFVQSIKEIRDSIPTMYDDESLVLPTIESSFKFHRVTLHQLKIYIKGLKSNSDQENITKNVLLDSFEVIGSKLKAVINDSLESGSFPSCWKTSTIIPIEKKINTTKCSEFRPINTLPSLEKILEKTVKDQLLKYLEDNKIFAKEQSGQKISFN